MYLQLERERESERDCYQKTNNNNRRTQVDLERSSSHDSCLYVSLLLFSFKRRDETISCESNLVYNRK